MSRADSRLNGTPISSDGTSAAAVAFDGNTGTVFQSSGASYGWVGLDLGKPYVITIVGWAPESATGALLGVFEGANRADFMDAVPLKIISEDSYAKQMNYERVQCSRGVRYIRYVSPDGKYTRMAELEFYGDAGTGSDTHLAQLTNLPVVTIHTQNNQIPFDKITEIPAFISIISNNGQTIIADDATIRERGNYSRNFPKKPYRIKFARKYNVLGAPAYAKKWTLINNYGDKTLMRNQLAFELSRRLGMPYTPFCAYVDVLLNGEYKGCYQLCDQIEVRSGRVDVTEMTTKDNSGTALTGGYLFEADAYAYEEDKYFYSTKGTPVTLKSPKADSITTAQFNYIEQRYNLMEGQPARYLDRNTFLRHFLVGELSGNTDTYWSVYMYKKRGNDTIFTGPVWDFDLAFDNDNRTYPVNNKTDYIYRSGGSTVGYLKTLADKMAVNDNTGKQMLYAIWDQARRRGLTEENMLAYVDQQARLLEQSQRLNFMRWPIMNSYVHQNPRIWGSYAAEVNNVKNFLKNRIAWMDRKLGYQYTDIPYVSAPDSAKTIKILQDGHIYIIRNGSIYSIEGTLIQK